MYIYTRYLLNILDQPQSQSPIPNQVQSTNICYSVPYRSILYRSQVDSSTMTIIFVVLNLPRLVHNPADYLPSEEIVKQLVWIYAFT